MKNKVALIFIMLGLMLALIAIPKSGALSEQFVLRNAAGGVTPDTSAVLKLVGFSDPIDDVENPKKNYSTVGSITNNSRETINLTITIIPDFSNMNNKNFFFGMKFGSSVYEFTDKARGPQQAHLTMSPGSSVNVEATLYSNAGRRVPTKYQFTASSASGNISMQLNDTEANPRRITFR